MNNKKYFVKHLPAEGEIKEGDLYINTEIKPGEKNYGKIYTGFKWVLKNGYEGNGYKDKNYFAKYMRKVKLFLCSRDIQVGDKVLIDGTFEEIIVPSNMDEKGIQIMAELEIWIKKIGEISEDVQLGISFEAVEAAIEARLSWITKNIPDAQIVRKY